MDLASQPQDSVVLEKWRYQEASACPEGIREAPVMTVISMFGGSLKNSIAKPASVFEGFGTNALAPWL